MNAYADSLMFLYGARRWAAGCRRGVRTCVGNALKWFPDRRGLAAGLTAGVRRGSALTIIPISVAIKSSGYESTFLYSASARASSWSHCP